MVQFRPRTFDPDAADNVPTDPQEAEPPEAEPPEWEPAYPFSVRTCDLVEWLSLRPPRDIPADVRRANIAANMAAQRKTYP